MNVTKIGRRQCLRSTASLLGTGALASLLSPSRAQAQRHFAPRAKRVVYLFMSGAPSQLETFDWKPRLRDLEGTELPASVKGDVQSSGMSSGQASFPVVPSRFGFAQHGASGAFVSEALPNIARIADRLCIVRSMRTEAVNHDPALSFIHTGNTLVGRPCLGSWLSYGLGDASSDLPTFAVLASVSSTARPPQPLASHVWSPGFLPPQYQGVPLRGGREPVLYLDEPSPTSASTRSRMRAARADLDALHRQVTGNPDIDARIAAYELAFDMQVSVPELLRPEPESTYALYGDDARRPGTFAANCVLARKLLEADVPFVQLYHRDWDQHVNMMTDFPIVARDTDRACAALVEDLERRGLLEDTLVIWGGEFGRTVYGQGESSGNNYGRDHHRGCFSMWMAGGGIKAGLQYGQTDDFSFNIVSDPVDIHDFHATILHLLGFDHTRLTYRHSGRDFRLTDVAGRVIGAWLA